MAEKGQPLTVLKIALSLVCFWPVSSVAAVPSVDFNRDIKPLLSDRCFACHGPDAEAREAELRLDVREHAVESAIALGNPDESEMLRRITTDDLDQRMPPLDSGKRTLSEAEIQIVRQWIEQGAEYSTHWAYAQPVRTEAPRVRDPSWCKNAIDHFILNRLEAERLQPSPPADRRTLIRRLSFDLIGLPPSTQELDQFMADSAADAYEKVVDRLLRSKHFGERMAMYWLDVVRYADTNGIHGDNHRDHGSYRDYVIKAFNDNKPYDEFILEQLAGDLIPESTFEQLIASGFNRLNMTTREGGAQPKEYRAIYAADRVRNIGTIFLGSTIGCAQCHDHKFDPFTAKDFYSFAAFFADIKETAVGVQTPLELPPIMHVEEARAERATQLREKLAEVRRQLNTQTPQLDSAREEWENSIEKSLAEQPSFEPWYVLGPFKTTDFEVAHTTAFIQETAAAIEVSHTFGDGKLRWREQTNWTDGKVHPLQGENSATYLTRIISATSDRPLVLSLGSDDSLKVWLNGELLLDEKVQRGVAPDQNKITANLKAGDNQLLLKVANGSGGHGFYFNPLASEDAGPVLEILKTPRSDRTEKQKRELAAHFRSIAPQLQPARDKLQQLQAEYERLTGGDLPILVSESVTPRTMRVLPRGNWLDDSGQVVRPDTPAFLSKLAIDRDKRASRLDLARWMTSVENPLVARVYVNRLWKIAFGHGLVRSLDDFGSQGTPPSHPRLLDWLATELIASGWNTKHILKLLVMSATYRQSSDMRDELRQRDPRNQLLARQNRFRLDAEMVRDTALAVSGLLAPKIGGPSVRPYQPAGYWDHLNFPQRKYQHDTGQNQYRRGLYTYWCRTFLHPSLLAFDAPTREECTVERPRSNTPQAALVLLNDPTYVEASRVFAQRIMLEGGDTFNDRLRYAFALALHRAPRAAETEILTGLFERHLREYQVDNEAADRVRKAGLAPTDNQLDKPELAAWTSVTRTILNLHEVISRN